MTLSGEKIMLNITCETLNLLCFITLDLHREVGDTKQLLLAYKTYLVTFHFYTTFSVCNKYHSRL